MPNTPKACCSIAEQAVTTARLKVFMRKNPAQANPSEFILFTQIQFLGSFLWKKSHNYPVSINKKTLATIQNLSDCPPW
jgi:hypothetical protein